MPIFKKIVTETMEGDYDEYRDLMNSQCKETIVDWANWNNDEEYAISGLKAPDFFIEAKKPKEPKYDVYFKFDDKIKVRIVKAYLNCQLSLVLEKLTEFNKDYIIKQAIPTYEAMKNSRYNGTKLLYYVCERRK